MMINIPELLGFLLIFIAAVIVALEVTPTLVRRIYYSVYIPYLRKHAPCVQEISAPTLHKDFDKPVEPSSMTMLLTGTPMRPVAEMCALVTGGAGELGTYIVQDLLREGVGDVIVWDVDDDLLRNAHTLFTSWTKEYASDVVVDYVSTADWQSVSSEIACRGPARRLLLLQVDVADADRTAQALLYATRALGVLVPHLVFHNAGWLAAQPLLAQSEGPLAAFRVNAAHTQLHRQLLHRRHAFHAHWPLLDRAQHQSVVVASAAGLSHAVRLADYCAAKAAAIASARSLRLELARASADPAFHAESFAGGPGDAATARLCAKASFRGVRVDRHFAWTQDGAGETARRIVGWTPRPPLGLSVLAPLLPLPPQPVVASGPASCPADCFPAYPVAAATSLRLALPWHIRTPMFHAIAANTLTRLLFPSLCPRAVARALVGPCLRSVGHAQSSGYCSFEADEMVLPPVLKYLLPVLALLPTYISDVLTGFVGGWYGMDTYLGRDSGELKSDRIGASLWDRCIYGKGNISTDSYVTFMVDKEVKSG